MQYATFVDVFFLSDCNNIIIIITIIIIIIIINILLAQ